jgi:hypothetical protein
MVAIYCAHCDVQLYAKFPRSCPMRGLGGHDHVVCRNCYRGMTADPPSETGPKEASRKEPTRACQLATALAAEMAGFDLAEWKATIADLQTAINNAYSDEDTRTAEILRGIRDVVWNQGRVR